VLAFVIQTDGIRVNQVVNMWRWGWWGDE